MSRVRKVVVVALVALATSACAMHQTRPDGVTERVPSLQVGANVQVLDLCGGEPGMLYGTHGYAVNGLRTLPGRHFWVAMPTESGINTFSVGLTYVAMSGGMPRGSVSRSFSVNHHRGSQRFQWVLTKDWRGWGRGGGGSNVLVDACPR